MCHFGVRCNYFQRCHILSSDTHAKQRHAYGSGHVKPHTPTRRTGRNEGFKPVGLLSAHSNRIVDFGTINRIHDFIEPGHKIFWLSVLDIGMAALMGLFNSIAYGLNSSVRRAIYERLDLLPERFRRWLLKNLKSRGQQQDSELVSLKIEDQQ
ncbi:G-protein coupled receptor 1-like [Actinidia eriantha]|uniref:G-protein coupled receptor 1-like n=1 Tax=Actinidia eriantha TaxID=165200 RepID=UPI00258E0EDA|nr:G-protein coupled receptor 1-like [Actinidia eriantha]